MPHQILGRIAVTLLALRLLFGGAAFGGETAAGASDALGIVPLSSAEELRVRRFLHPLPHELHLRNSAIRVSPAAAGLIRSPEESARVRQFLDDFKARWEAQYGAFRNNDGVKLRLVAGLAGSHPALKQAAADGAFDAKYLAERPNVEQAYALVVRPEGDGAAVYIAGQGESGLYYGLLTFEQLLQSLSSKPTLAVPQAEIVDWPDLAHRGSWTVLSHQGNNETAMARYGESLRAFAEWKYNFCEVWSVRADLSETGAVAAIWPFPKEVLALGDRYAVRVFPGTAHLTGPFLRNEALMKRFPEVQGVKSSTEKTDRKPECFCLNAPGVQDIFDAYVRSIAEQFDFVDLWMSELEGERGACHCPKCAGDTRKAFLKETQLLMHAYAKAKEVNPQFRILLGLTQGSYSYNMELLDFVPKDVWLNYYNGCTTYKTSFQKYNLSPALQEMRRRGYIVGSTPSPTASHYYGGIMMYPFETPWYCKMLAAENIDSGMDFILLHLPSSPFMNDVNAQAMAEFLWNRNGRTPEEFAASWALRRGLDNPEETAAILALEEFAARGFSNCHGNGSVAEGIVKPVVQFFTNKGGIGNWAYRGFEYNSHEELARVRADCETATKRAAALNNPELQTGCVLLQRWITILERYAYAVENPKSEEIRKESFQAIRDEVRKLPESRNAWFAFQEPRIYLPHWKKIAQQEWDAVMTAWAPLLETTAPTPSAGAKEIAAAEKAGTVRVQALDPAWRFKTDPQQEGVEGKWFAPELDDAKWAAVRSDQNCGWEKQGFPDYTGYGWYRQRVNVPADLAARPRLLLFFGAVDEDAEVYINGVQVFVHDFKTAHTEPGATWDMPFLFDVKANLVAGRENVIAVRVYNRAGMGGIWKPAALMSCDAFYEPKTVAEFLAVR